MDGKTICPENKLPTRHNRNSKVNANKNAYVEQNPLIIGWKFLKSEKWGCKRSDRENGLQHAIEKCYAEEMRDEELYKIMGLAKNNNALKDLQY